MYVVNHSIYIGTPFLLVIDYPFISSAQTRANHPLFYPHIFRLVRIVLAVAFALAIVGATKASDSDASDRTTGATLRKVGGIIILACFIFMAFVHVLLWTYKSRLYTRHRTVSFLFFRPCDKLLQSLLTSSPENQLLLGISTALPFLLVRCIYSVLSAFSPVSSFGGGSSNLPVQHNSLSKFNSFSGSWQIFLAMSLVMEYVVVLIYLTVGAVTPLERGTDDGSEEDLKGGQHELYQQRPANVDAFGGSQGYAA